MHNEKMGYCLQQLILTLLCTLALLVTAPAYANECTFEKGSSREVLEVALEACQQQIEKTDKQLRAQQHQRTNIEYDILLIAQLINEALLRIRSSDLIINQLNQEVRQKEVTVEELNENITTQQAFLSEVLQRINESEQKGFVNLLLSDVSVSSFFTRTNEYVSLRQTMEDSIRSIGNLRFRLTASVEELEKKQEQQSRIRQQQQADATQIQSRKNEQEKILAVHRAREDQLERQIDEYETRAAQIRNRLFEFSGGGAIPFEAALNIANEVERAFGIRPAFLLGLIKHESDLGKNVGTGNYKADMHPTRDQPIFPYIAKLVGADPDELRVSANPGFGWGGAMGPAQFIPSTWVCYGGMVNVTTATCSYRQTVLTSTALLEKGTKGREVRRLQEFLNDQGFTVANSGPGSPGNETTIFGDAVERAVKRFQEKYAKSVLKPYGYTRGTGKVGPSTRRAINHIAFFSGPWKYSKAKDRVRKYTGSDAPSNPWNPRDALFASGLYLKELKAHQDECTAARRYYAGSNWGSQVARKYCQAVLSNARSFQRDIDYLEQ